MPSTKSRLRIVVLGGGTGSYVLLSGLKRCDDCRPTSIVNMVDNGGSTGLLRTELGVLPPGDVRQCLVALAQNERLASLCTYRFEEGSLKGHPFGNLMLAALQKQTGSFADAVMAAGEALEIRGSVVPVTLDDTHLLLSRSDNTTLRGQRQIEDSPMPKRPGLSLEPAARANPAAVRAIADADLVVIAPGDLYTSIAPILLVDGMASALRATTVPVVYVANLVTKTGQTDGFTAADIVDELERFAGGPLVDIVVCNTHQPTDEQLRRYAKAGEQMIAPASEALEATGKHVVARDIIATSYGATWQDCDPLARIRSYIRHDPDALAQVIMEIAHEQAH